MAPPPPPKHPADDAADEEEEEEEEEDEDGESESESDAGLLATTKDHGTGLLQRREAKYSANDFVQWTGFKKKVPVLVFHAAALDRRISELRQLGEKYHMTYKLYMHECKLVRNILAAHGFREAHPNSSDFNLMWTGSHVKPFVLRSMLEHQKINHFPRSYELTRKDRLYKNVQRMQQLKGFKHFDFVPTTYVLPTEFNDFTSAFLRDKGTWIVKPVASSRGRGIFLVNHPDQVPPDETFVVCRYIQKPFLIDGFKFDLRLYVAVTSFDPLLIYLFEEGLTRFATVRFDKSQRNIQNQCMHLTNYSVNKKNDDFVRNEDPNVEDYGNKWSLGALLRCLREEGHDATAVMMRIEDVIIKTILSAEAPIATACKMFMPHRGNCFEIFGFDILLDSNLRPWVLEVNLSPSLNCDSPIDLKIKAHMVSDLLSLSGFVLHDPCTRVASAANRRAASASSGGSAATGDAGRQQRLQRPQSATTGRPSSASRARGQANGSGPATLTPEEVKLVRRVKEEHARRGGWLRIFPTQHTWDLYADFLQFTTTSNSLIHEQLFGDSSDLPPHAKRQNGMPSLLSKLRSLHIHDTPAHAFIAGNNQAYERLYVAALQRSTLYERKLGEEPVPVKKLRSQATYVGSVAADPAIAAYPPRGSAASAAAAAVAAPGAVELPPPQQQAAGRGQMHQLTHDQPMQLPEQQLPPRVAAGRPRLATDEPLRNREPPVVLLPASESVQGSHRHLSQPQQQQQPQVVALAQGLDGLADSTAKRTVHAGCVDTANVPDGRPASQSTAAARVAGTDPAVPSHSRPVAPGHTAANTDHDGWDAVKQLQSGVLMSKMQARRAFATYLTRVQHRLLAAADDRCTDADDGASGDEANDEQTDLVLRFLKRAAANLSHPFKVVMPSRRLPVGVRRRILAKQLGDFVHLYSKETDALKTAEAQKKTPHNGIDADTILQQPCHFLDESKFESFVSFADEAELEVLLTAYTKINKSASTFLGRSGVAVDHGRQDGAHDLPPAATSAIDASSSDLPQPPRAAADRAGPSVSADSAEHGAAAHWSRAERAGIHRAAEAAPQGSSQRSSELGGSVSGSSSAAVRSQSLLDDNRGGGCTAPEVMKNAQQSLPHRQTGGISSYPDAVHIYSTRLQRPASASGAGRPRSASGGGPAAGRAGRPASARHASSAGVGAAASGGAAGSQSRLHVPYGNGEGLSGDRVVATAFDEAAPDDVHAVLQNLRLRQRARNYRTLNVAATGSAAAEGSASDAAPPAAAAGRESPALEPSAVDMASEGDLVAAYSAVTGVRPTAAFVPSKHSSQYELLLKGDSSDRQLQMIAASRALLDASKAMHQEMVAQAHAASKKLRDVTFPTAADAAAVAGLAPRPPAVPRSTATGTVVGRRQTTAGATRRQQIPSAAEGGAAAAAAAAAAADQQDSAAAQAFYSGLRYDALTGQSRPAVK